MKDDKNRWRQFCTVYEVVDATRLSKFTKACADRKLHNFVRGTRTQPIICVGCPVGYWGSCAFNKGGFFEIAFVVAVVDIHLPRIYVLPHIDALTHLVIRVSSAFIFQTFAEVCYSVFVNRSSFWSFKSVLNFRKAYIFKSLLKVCYRSVFNESSKAFIFRKCAERLHPE